MLLGLWLMLGVCGLSALGSCMSHCLCLVLYMVVEWNENERSRIRAVQRDKLRGLQDIRRIDKVQNARIRELCGVTKAMDEKIDEVVL